MYSNAFEKIKLLERGSLTYVVVEPEEETKSTSFQITAIDSQTGQTTQTIQIPCHTNFDNVAYVGDYVVWTEADLLKWTPITKKEIKSISIKVKRPKSMKESSQKKLIFDMH